MKTLLNNFTTQEQSKILIELGVPADSCDNYYIAEDEAMPNWLPYKKSYSEWRKEAFGLSHGYTEIIPCWSVGRLIELHEILFPQYKNFIIERDDVTLISRMVKYYEIGAKQGVLDFSKLED